MQRDDLKSTIWELTYTLSNLEINEGNWPSVYGDGVVERLSTEYNLKDEVVDIINRERQFKKEAESYNLVNLKKNRNPARHELKVKSVHDTKHDRT